MNISETLGKIRWRLVAGVPLLTALILTLTTLRDPLLGWLGGEPYYSGAPLSFWRHQLRDWRITPEHDLETVDDERQNKTHQVSEQFMCVLDHPGRWSLEHRNTPAQWRDSKERTLKNRREWRGTVLNPTYGAPFCKLAIFEGDPDAVPVLMDLLKDEAVCIRRLAAAALDTIGPQARQAFPALLESATNDKDAFLRGIARTALLDIDKAAAENAGIFDHFIFWSPQPWPRATISGHFFLDSPKPSLNEGKILAWDDQDLTVALLELATGKLLASFPAPRGYALPIVFSPDGKTVASANKNKMTVKVWDLTTGKDLATLTGHTDAIESLAFSPDGKTLASGSSDKMVKLWDVSNGKNTVTLRGHIGTVRAVAFSPDGKILASGGSYPDRAVRLWDLPTGTERATIQHDPMWGWVKCLAFSPDGKTLASGGAESSVILVDVVNGKKRGELDDGDESGSLGSVAFSPNGQLLAYVSWDQIFICDVAMGKKTVKIPAEPGNVDRAVFAPSGRILAVTRGRDDHKERLWEFAAPDLAVARTDTLKPGTCRAFYRECSTPRHAAGNSANYDRR